MRRFVFLTAGVAAVVAGVAAVAFRSRGASGRGWRERLMLTATGLPSGPRGWVGCGSGAFLQRHAAHVRHVAGLDASGIPVGMAQRRLADRIAAGTAEIVLGDAMALPWPDDRFSVVTAYACPELVTDPLKALSEMHRVLRPGGRALLTLGFPLKDASLSGTKSAWGIWRWSEADARRLMEEAGFGDVSISPPPSTEFSLQLARGTKPASPSVAEAAETPALAQEARG
jgi:SAM-dependent methyltransferase